MASIRGPRRSEAAEPWSAELGAERSADAARNGEHKRAPKDSACGGAETGAGRGEAEPPRRAKRRRSAES
jgi:hypothetical protein